MSDDGVLDAEYRAFVRAHHDRAVATVVAAQTWLSKDAPAIWALANSEIAGREPSDDEVRVAKQSEESWDRAVGPQLRTLVVGHPDPDVSAAAKLAESRVWASFFVLRQALSGKTSRGPAHAELTGRVFGSPAIAAALTRLGTAVRGAPSRIRRPLPDPTMPADPGHHPSFPEWFDAFERLESEFDRARG